jgi:hypothetical protein
VPRTLHELVALRLQTVHTSSLPPQRPARTTSCLIVKRTSASGPPPAPPSPLVADDPFPCSRLPSQGQEAGALLLRSSTAAASGPCFPAAAPLNPTRTAGRGLPLARDVPCLTGIDPRRVHVQCFIPSWVGIIREGLQKLSFPAKCRRNFLFAADFLNNAYDSSVLSWLCFEEGIDSYSNRSIWKLSTVNSLQKGTSINRIYKDQGRREIFFSLFPFSFLPQLHI